MFKIRTILTGTLSLTLELENFAMTRKQSIVATCYQLCSTKVNARCHIPPIVVSQTKLTVDT